MYLYRSFLNYSLLIVTVLCFGCHTTLISGIEVNKSDLDSKKVQKVFSTPKEANEYSNHLMKLFYEKKYSNVLALSFPEPILPLEWQAVEQSAGKISLLNDYEMTWLESYRFQRAYTLAKIYYDEGNKNTINPDLVRKYYQQSIDQITIYISSPVFGVNYESSKPEINLRLNDHRAAIYELSRDVYYHWSSCEAQQQFVKSSQSKELPVKKQPANKLNCEAAKKMLLLAIDHTQKAIDYTLEVTPINEVALRKNKLYIGKVYINIANFCDEKESKEYLERAKQVSRELTRDTKAKLEAEELKKAIEFYTEHVNPRQYRDNHLTKIERSGNLKHMRQLKETNDNVKMMEQFDVLVKNPSSDFHTRVIQNQNRLIALVRKNYKDPQIIPLLKELEQEIQQQLIESHSPSTLIDIYHTFGKISLINVVINEMKVYFLPAFLNSQDFQGALDRVEALASLELERRGKNSDYTRWLRASIKNLYGDFSEWEEIEQEAILLLKGNQEKKDTEKKRQEQQQAARIREHQQKMKVEQDKREKDKPKVNTNSQIPSKPINTEELDLTIIQNVDHQSSSALSLKEHKDAKMKRHKEAEEQRVAQNNVQNIEQEDVNNIPDPSSFAAPMISDPLIDHKELPKIKDVYKDLSKNSKMVDDQIENDTWMFTRENLIRYFRNLDCKDKPGGKHPKVSLPETTIISFDGTTIAIFNDLGGALTLPSWDKSTKNKEVPDYLRAQILNAREKLVQLKVKANKELELLQRDQPQSPKDEEHQTPEKG